MCALKAKKPEKTEKRLKMFVYGPAGIGKTTAAIQFPNSYIIDTERGTDFYADTIIKSNSVVLQTLNPDEIREEIRSLLVERHPYKTLVIDPITQVYNATQEKWTRIFEHHATTDKAKEVQDFGMRYWGKVKADFKSIQRLFLALDMNIIITSHQKDVYGSGMTKTGVTFDSMKGDDYFFDIVLRVERSGTDLIAYKIKERAEVGQEKFPDSFVWNYDNFCKYYGKDILEKESTPIPMASDEQVAKIKKLVENVKIDEATINQWLLKADVDDWSEMKSDTIQKCIDFLETKIKNLK